MTQNSSIVDIVKSLKQRLVQGGIVLDTSILGSQRHVREAGHYHPCQGTIVEQFLGVSTGVEK